MRKGPVQQHHRNASLFDFGKVMFRRGLVRQTQDDAIHPPLDQPVNVRELRLRVRSHHRVNVTGQQHAVGAVGQLIMDAGHHPRIVETFERCDHAHRPRPALENPGNQQVGAVMTALGDLPDAFPRRRRNRRNRRMPAQRAGNRHRTHPGLRRNLSQTGRPDFFPVIREWG